ncbi:MAG: histidine kinase [Lachnospiraceae bacterium]|nr:histidine kinase [Lachnospiraceae bacterium]
MKSIRGEIHRSYFVLIIFTCVFITANILVNAGSSSRYNGLLQDYRQVNELSVMNNDRKISFKLYCKSHESMALEKYSENCRRLNARLSELAEKMKHDRQCKMMHRIVCQVVKHHQELAYSYIQPDSLYSPGDMGVLDEVDLEIERCLNQLMSQYLEYLNKAFEDYSRQMNMVNLFMNLVLIAGCLFTLSVNYRMSRDMLKSISRLTFAAREITNKNFGVQDIEETAFEELNQVSGTFDQMKHTICNMITELNETYQMKERLAEAKIRELQMQMNPHFLFNTLSLVIRSVQMGERDIAIQLVKSISQILRSSIEIKTTAIPLDEEIELLQAYLYIQKLHLKGRIRFCLDVRKSFLDDTFMIPPLTIQPLVENSIQHGLKDRVSGGKVDILITEKPDHMEVVVADNGVGFPSEEEKKGSQDKTRPGDKVRTSIGLNNVKERLSFFYRKEDVLRIEREDGITRITLKLYKAEEARGE